MWEYFIPAESSLISSFWTNLFKCFSIFYPMSYSLKILRAYLVASLSSYMLTIIDFYKPNHLSDPDPSTPPINKYPSGLHKQFKPDQSILDVFISQVSSAFSINQIQLPFLFAFSFSIPSHFCARISSHQFYMSYIILRVCSLPSISTSHYFILSFRSVSFNR